MKLKSGDRVYEVVRRSESDFAVDGIMVQASAERTAGCRFEARTVAGRTTAFVARDGDRVFAHVGGRSYTLLVVTRADLGSAHPTASGSLEAPMPGRVTRVAVAVGETVVRGQELIIVEAMKMENALVAPEGGTVASLAVRVGDMVTPGSVLIVIESAP